MVVVSLAFSFVTNVVLITISISDHSKLENNQTLICDHLLRIAKPQEIGEVLRICTNQ